MSSEDARLLLALSESPAARPAQDDVLAAPREDAGVSPHATGHLKADQITFHHLQVPEQVAKEQQQRLLEMQRLEQSVTMQLQWAQAQQQQQHKTQMQQQLEDVQLQLLQQHQQVLQYQHALRVLQQQTGDTQGAALPHPATARIPDAVADATLAPMASPEEGKSAMPPPLLPLSSAIAQYGLPAETQRLQPRQVQGLQGDSVNFAAAEQQQQQQTQQQQIQQLQLQQQFQQQQQLQQRLALQHMLLSNMSTVGAAASGHGLKPEPAAAGAGLTAAGAQQQPRLRASRAGRLTKYCRSHGVPDQPIVRPGSRGRCPDYLLNPDAGCNIYIYCYECDGWQPKSQFYFRHNPCTRGKTGGRIVQQFPAPGGAVEVVPTTSQGGDSEMYS